MIPGHSSISRVPRVGAAGGGGRLWTPADISDLVAWWDADSGVTLTDGAVSAWASKIGTGTFTQATAAQRPTMTTIAGVPALLLDGSNQRMSLPGRETNPGGFLYPDPFTENASFLMVGGPTANYGSLFSLDNGGMAIGLMGSGSVQRPGVAYGSSNIQLSEEVWTGVRSFSFEWQKTPATGMLRGVQNGAPVVNRSASGPGSNLNYYPGVLGFNSAGYSWRGTISALAMARTLLRGSDQDRWEGYYAHKLGTTAYLSASHPYKSAPPRV